MSLKPIVALILALNAAGCTSSPGAGEAVPPALIDLQEVADLLRAAAGTGRTPTKLADLAATQSMYPRGFEALKSGEIVVLWGAPIAGEGAASEGGAPQAVLAHEKNAPAEGGYVLLQDGTVKPMTADEFKAAPKAK